MSKPAFRVAHLDEIPKSGNVWIPVRRHFGIRAFGVNAWTGAEGQRIISDHVEDSGHEELYVVVRGHAVFTVEGEEVDAPAGTIVFVADPGRRRGASAKTADTVILTVGAKPGEAFQTSAWEVWVDAAPHYEAKDYDAAIEVLEEARRRFPDDPGLLYNLACCESLAGRADDAIEHLRRSIERSQRFAELARDDEDFDPIRGDARFRELVQVAE